MSSIIMDDAGSAGGGPSRCLLLLQRSLAIQLTRGPPQILNGGNKSSGNAGNNSTQHDPCKDHPADEMWMYDKGYNLFQGFLEANSRCWWNVALVDATRQLRYKGHVAPGVLMVGGPPCALEVLRAAWARNVLRPPADHIISCLGDIEDCLVTPVSQGQFTPLPEALCWAILELTSQRQAATLDTVRSALRNAFPAMQRPSRDLVYDALAKLMQDRKIYHTAQGYFVVTPETRRLRRESGSTAGGGGQHRSSREMTSGRSQPAGMLMSNDEAMALVHGEMITLRDGDVTHQAVQTNLADVICGGNPNDKVLFARCQSVPGRLERRHSLRLWGSARRLHRSGSSRSLPRRPERSDTSSSAEYASTDSAPHSPTSLSGIFSEKIGLLSRLFRRSTRRKGAPLMGTFSAQYPPTEWFNPRVVHLHSVATQTRAASPSMMEGLEHSQASFQVWDDSSSLRSATLPRRHHHHRQPSADSSSLLANSTPRSSRRHRSPCSTLPRSKCSSLSRCTSRASVVPSSTTNGPSPQQQQPQSNGKSNNSTNSSPSRSGGSSGSVRAAPASNNSCSPAKASGHFSRLQGSRHSSRRPSHELTPSNGPNCPTKSTNGSPQHKVLQKSSSNHSSHSSGSKSTSSGRLSASPLKTASLSANSSPLKVIQQPQQSQQQTTLTPLQEGTQNSITLQVSTNLSPSQELQGAIPSVQSSVTLASNATSTTTISGSPGTKIYVHQNSSPMRSVITFENNKSSTTTTTTTTTTNNNNNNKSTNNTEEQHLLTEKANSNKQPVCTPARPERPSSLYANNRDNNASDKENKPKLQRQDAEESSTKNQMLNKLSNNYRLNNSQAHLIDGGGNGGSDKPTSEQLNMNNSRKLSLSLSKDALSYRNLLRPSGSKNNVATAANTAASSTSSSNPPSPTKSYGGGGSCFGGSYNNVYIEKQLVQQQGSEPSLFSKTPSRPELYSYPSLSDMQVQFTSLAAQKILKGCPLNSVDTLVEVNMAAADKPCNNRDLAPPTVHTDFGLV
ncbi:uncharacterized protein LOC106646797 [Copidosoma floridanum]|uniref:uncharacterized protein LOC106646797 n=1 Tax=Copidosoma floridanum TaxID=29053 RepID=UPI000C6F7C7E|nr:uncharacterized protein LOC106646797 [Copidosoma floridanum]